MSYNLERTKELLGVYNGFIDGKRIEVFSEHVGEWNEIYQLPLSNDWIVRVTDEEPTEPHYALCSWDYKRALWDAKELLEAFVDGKALEFYNQSTGWQPVSQSDAQSWDFTQHKWRIVGEEDGQPYLKDYCRGGK